jgi:hypothetical protein
LTVRRQVLAFALSLLAIAPTAVEAADPETPASPWYAPTWQAEAWYFFQNTSDTAQQQKLTLRFYQHFLLPDDWQLIMREDVRTLYGNEVGPDDPRGTWLVHSGDWFAQGVLKTPPVAPGLAVLLGLRVVFPTGNLPPFGTGRFVAGPLFAFVWDPPGTNGTITLAPHVAYFQSFGGQPEHSVPTSAFEFRPIISLKGWPGWAITFWREHPIALDALTNRWFVPIDAMVTREIVPHLSVGVGVAVGLVSDFPQFSNIVYGRVAFSF